MPDHHQNATLDHTAHREGEPIQIELQAAELARNHAVTRRRVKRPAFLARERPVLLKRLDQQEELLRSAYQRFRTTPPDAAEFPYAAEWVLDNFYLIEQSVRLIREDMPVGYYRQLPTLDSPLLRGYPRAFALAWHLIERASGQVDLDEVRRLTARLPGCHSADHGRIVGFAPHAAPGRPGAPDAGARQVGQHPDSP